MFLAARSFDVHSANAFGRFCLGAENGVPCSKKRSASDAAFSEVFSRIVHVQNRVRNQGTTLCKAVQSGVGS